MSVSPERNSTSPAHSPVQGAATTASTKEQGESFDELLTWAYTAAGERLHRVGERLRALPAWLSVLLIYGLSRVWGFIVFAVVGQQQLRSPWGQHLDYLSFISIWDAGWYEQIAVQGYPNELPVNAAGGLFTRFSRSFPVLLAMRRASGTTRWRRRLLCLPVSRRRG